VRRAQLIVRCFLCERGAARAFHEAGVADAGAVFQGEVYAAGRVNIGATFSAAVFVAIVAIIVWFGHGLPRMSPASIQA
jgi:hypothetical protein